MDRYWNMAITEPQVEARRMKGQAIAELNGQIEKDQANNYRVKSQCGDWYYIVTPLETGWSCSCPDFIQRGVEACKHIFAVQFRLKIRETVKVEREKKELVLEQFNATSCLFCKSPNLKKFGLRHHISGDIQRFRCL